MNPVVIAVPDRDFDPTETTVPWWVLRQAGVPVQFATERGPDGPAPECDPKLIGHPLLRIMGLTARRANVERYRELERSTERQRPIRWSEIDPAATAAIVLPGGHWKRGMRQFLDGKELHAAVLRLVKARVTVASICHGAIALARTIDPDTGASVVAGKRIAALPRHLELSAWLATALFLGDYYRTYPETVEAELTRAVGPGGAFVRGGLVNPFYSAGKRTGLVVQDGGFITARWPGDSLAWSLALLERVRGA